jgi:plastocyanin
MRGFAKKVVTQNGIHNRKSIQERYVGYETLKRGGLALLLISLLVISPFAIAAPSAFRITVGTFFPYYSPEFVHIGTGTPITWENPTSDLHSITHDGCKTGEGCAFDSGPLGPNGTYTVRHLPPGHYPYHCTFHPIMRGTLVVTESDTSSET